MYKTGESVNVTETTINSLLYNFLYASLYTFLTSFFHLTSHFLSHLSFSLLPFFFLLPPPSLPMYILLRLSSLSILPFSLPPSLSLTSQKEAEDICNVIDQAFEIVYTEITVQKLRESIDRGSSPPPPHRRIPKRLSSSAVLPPVISAPPPHSRSKRKVHMHHQQRGIPSSSDET